MSLLTSCGSKDASPVQAVNNTPLETETSTVMEETTTSTTEIQSETETETTIETETISETETETETTIETETVSETETQGEEGETSFAFTSTPLDQTMYAKKNCNVREKPSTDYGVVAYLEGGKEVHVTGKVNEVDWYEVEIDSEKAYVSASLLTSDLPTPSSTTIPPASNTDGYTKDANGYYIDEYGDKYGMDENGHMIGINPATGEIYKEGDTTPEGWTYGVMW